MKLLVTKDILEKFTSFLNEHNAVFTINDDTLFLETDDQSFIDTVLSHYEELNQAHAKQLDDNNTLRKSYFEGRAYIRKGRWYGLNPYYNKEYYNMNYNYRSSNYQTYPVHSNFRSSGLLLEEDCILLGYEVVATQSSRKIDNLHVLVNTLTPVDGGFQTNRVFADEEGLLIEKGYNVNETRMFPEEYVLSKGDKLQMIFNSSATDKNTAYLIDCQINMIFRWV